ncbi:MAG: hypothetical protein WCN89_04620, partial [bacterium]
ALTSATGSLFLLAASISIVRPIVFSFAILDKIQNISSNRNFLSLRKRISADKAQNPTANLFN